MAEGVVHVTTADGAPTIAGLELQRGPCQVVVSSCRPASSTQAASPDAPCAAVDVSLWFPGTVCDLVLTSVDHRMVTTTATLRAVPGTDFQCREAGETVTAFETGIDPPAIVVDFSQGTAAAP
jgi:hypothetical protein